MDSSSIFMLIAMILLVTASAYFSATETAFMSFNRIRLKNLAQNGNKKAALVLDIADDFDRLLSSVLIGNNLVNISLSSLATVMFIRFFADMGPTISTITVTVVVLIFGEISPKSIAKEYADNFVMANARVVKAIIILFYPINFLFLQWKRLLRRIVKPNHASSITEEELMTIVDEAEKDGGIDANEGELIRSAIEFTDATAADILTPRVDVTAVSIEDGIEHIAQVFLNTGFSRLPVYREDMDDIIGILHEKDLFYAKFHADRSLRDAIKKPVYVSSHIKISNLLEVFKKAKNHMAIVVDEFGGMLGIVTMEDVIEELIGDVWDEHDTVVEHISHREDGTYIVNGMTDLEDFVETLDIVPEEDDDPPQTVNGWIIRQFGYFPAEGDLFRYGGYTIEVTKADSKRVAEIRVQKTEDIHTSALVGE